jgi:hypothetical protein
MSEPLPIIFRLQIIGTMIIWADVTEICVANSSSMIDNAVM